MHDTEPGIYPQRAAESEHVCPSVCPCLNGTSGSSARWSSICSDEGSVLTRSHLICLHSAAGPANVSRIAGTEQPVSPLTGEGGRASVHGSARLKPHMSADKPLRRGLVRVRAAGSHKFRDQCSENQLPGREDGASREKQLFSGVLQPGEATLDAFRSGDTPEPRFSSTWAGEMSTRVPGLATPTHRISPTYLLIKSSNHGLDPFHGFVSRHGRGGGTPQRGAAQSKVRGRG